MTPNHNAQRIRDSPRSVYWVSLVLLVVCSSCFSFYHSNTAYNTDEVWSIKTADLSYSTGLTVLRADVHPPLYFALLHFWIKVLGTEERTVRSLSGLFYILSTLAVFGLGRELYGTKTAVLCAVVYLSSPLAILTAQFARMYALLSLLSILSTWLYLQFSLKPRDSRTLISLYVVVNVLGTLTHIGFFFLLFAQVVTQFIFYRHTRMKRFLIAVGLSVVPYLLLWAPILVGQIANAREGAAWVKKPGLSMLGDLLLQFGGAFWLVVPLLLYLRWKRPSDSLCTYKKIPVTNFLLCLLAITLFTPLLISLAKPIFNVRLAIIGLHFFALTIGLATNRGSNYLLPFAVIVLTGTFMVIVHPVSTACDNRETAKYLSQTAKDDDVVIYTSLTRLPIDFYLAQTPTRKKMFETSFPAEIDKHSGYEGRVNDPNRKAALEREAQQLVEKITKMQFERIFFIHGFHPEIDAIVEQKLRENFELLPSQGIRCSEATYFKDVSVYRSGLALSCL